MSKTNRHSQAHRVQLARWKTFPDKYLGRLGIAGEGRCWHLGRHCASYQRATAPSRQVTEHEPEDMTAAQAKERRYGLCKWCSEHVAAA